ncbi:MULTISPECIES: WG repeat-containing protein [unclassified Microcoleus]
MRIHQSNRLVGDRPQVSAVGSFSEGLAAVKRDSKSGFINQAGKLVI